MSGYLSIPKIHLGPMPTICVHCRKPYLLGKGAKKHHCPRKGRR